MASRIVVTESELLDALAAAVPGTAPEDAMTVRELADAVGMSRDWVQKSLRLMHASGRLAVHRVKRSDLSGRMQITPAYTIRPK